MAVQGRHWGLAKATARTTTSFLYELKGTPAVYGAGINRAIENGWLMMHESGTYLRFTQAGADLFA